jgi:hypothetical protein
VERPSRERDAPLFQLSHVAELGGCVVQLPEDPLDVPEEGSTVTVQAEAAPLPVEQGNADLALQPGDGTAQRWLGEVEFLGRPGHVFEPSDDPEERELQQFHRYLPDRSCRLSYITILIHALTASLAAS